MRVVISSELPVVKPDVDTVNAVPPVIAFAVNITGFCAADEVVDMSTNFPEVNAEFEERSINVPEVKLALLTCIMFPVVTESASICTTPFSGLVANVDSFNRAPDVILAPVPPDMSNAFPDSRFAAAILIAFPVVTSSATTCITP